MSYEEIAQSSMKKAAALAQSETPTTVEGAQILATQVQTLLEVSKIAAQLDAAHDMRIMAARQQVARQ
jgi:hypothetical protein